MKKILFLALVLLAPVASAYENQCGDQCKDMPVCRDLGYSRASDIYCPEGYIACPFDSSYIWCKTYTCAMGGLVDKAGRDNLVNQHYSCEEQRFHGLTCYSCDFDMKACKFNEKNRGVFKGEASGNLANPVNAQGLQVPCPEGYYTQCLNLCENFDITPDIVDDEGKFLEGVIPHKVTCNACLTDTQIVDDFECSSGYEKIEVGTGVNKKWQCSPVACPAADDDEFKDYAYLATDKTNCATNWYNPDVTEADWHADGWLFQTKGISGKQSCSRCVPKPCPQGYKTDVNCANSAGYKFWDNGYSGNKICGYCESLTCEAPYTTEYTSIDMCPVIAGDENWSADKAWEFLTNGSAGDAACTYCKPKPCDDENGYTESEKLKCPNVEGYDIVYDTEHFYGDQYCGKCVAKDCPDGSETGLTKAKCQERYEQTAGIGSSIGVDFEVVKDGDYDVKSGLEQCTRCTCTPTAECKYKDQLDAGDYNKIAKGDGILSGICCDGETYTQCQKDETQCPYTLTEIKMEDLQYIQMISECTACGVTYYKVDSCISDDYKISDDGSHCVPKLCSDLGLLGANESCPEGYRAEQSDLNKQCNECVPMTCALWGVAENPENVGSKTWRDPSEQGCADGYQATIHNKKIGESNRECFDCNACAEREPIEANTPYVVVDKEEDIPAYVNVAVKFKSCDKVKYCAASCTKGYVKQGCACMQAGCGDYPINISGLVLVGGNIYKDQTGVLQFEGCTSGAVTTYKYKECTGTSSANITCDVAAGEYMVGNNLYTITTGQGDSAQTRYLIAQEYTPKDGETVTTNACVKCMCDITKTDDCTWTEERIQKGQGKDLCCDGLTYRSCEKDHSETSECTYELTEAPKHAETWDICYACGVPYYNITKCEEGYAGDTCASCDTDNGYAQCGTGCAKLPTCNHGHPKATCNADGTWDCDCDTGYKGTTSCDLCNDAGGYYLCDDRCQVRPVCQNGGLAKCGEVIQACDPSDSNCTPTSSTTWSCDCPEGYTGQTCDTCAEGYKDFGAGCVEDIDCGDYGEFNGTQCVCDDCHTGGDCTGMNTLCVEVDDGHGGTVLEPKSCENQGYEETCNETLYWCESQTVHTVGATLTCYSKEEKTCTDICGKYDISSKTLSHASVAHCKNITGENTLYAGQGAVYSWLKNDHEEGKDKQWTDAVCKDSFYYDANNTDHPCGKACYFDDEHCSVKGGTHMTEAKRAELISQGFVCKEKGYTPAGSTCYECINNQCPKNYVRKPTDGADRYSEEQIAAKEAAGFVCEKSIENGVAVKTDTGLQCYDCYDDTCPPDENNTKYVWVSKEEHPNYNGSGSYIQYEFADDLVGTESVPTEYGNYCLKIKSDNLRECDNQPNTTYETSTACFTKISGMKDYNPIKNDDALVNPTNGGAAYAPAAECHQCLSNTGQGKQRKLSWHASCRKVVIADTLVRDYSMPQMSNGRSYAEGVNCCVIDAGADEYDTKSIVTTIYNLGTKVNSQHCYTLNVACDLTDSGFCTGTQCTEIPCSTESYPYYNDGNGNKTFPSHSSGAGSSCRERNTICQWGDYYLYEKFQCDESHILNDNKDGCICEWRQGYYDTKEACEDENSAPRNIGHVCVFDEGNTDCWIKGGCWNKKREETSEGSEENTVRGYYDDIATCEAAYPGHDCTLDNKTQCYIDLGCDTDLGYYTNKETCENWNLATENLGYNCAEDSDTGCWKKNECDSTKGYYTPREGETRSDCENDVAKNYGYSCALDSQTGCEVRHECDATGTLYDNIKFYSSDVICREFNPDHKCTEATYGDKKIGCYVVTENCDGNRDMYNDEADCKNDFAGHGCQQTVSGCYTPYENCIADRMENKSEATESDETNYWLLQNDCELYNLGRTCSRPSGSTCYRPNSNGACKTGYYDECDTEKYDCTQLASGCYEANGCNHANGYYEDKTECEIASEHFQCGTYTGSSSMMSGQKWRYGKTCYKKAQNNSYEYRCVSGYYNSGGVCYENTCTQHSTSEFNDNYEITDWLDSCETVDLKCDNCVAHEITMPNNQKKTCYEDVAKTCEEFTRCYWQKGTEQNWCALLEAGSLFSWQNPISGLEEARDPESNELYADYTVAYYYNGWRACRACRTFTTVSCPARKDCSAYPYDQDYQEGLWIADTSSERCWAYNNDKGECRDNYKSRTCKSGYHEDQGICCENGSHADQGMCCPNGQHADSGHCCTADHHWNATYGKCTHDQCEESDMSGYKQIESGMFGDCPSCPADGCYNCEEGTCSYKRSTQTLPGGFICMTTCTYTCKCG